MAKSSKREDPRRPLPPDQVVAEAISRLARERALQTLVRGTIPLELLKKLLKHAFPRRQARELPLEVWASLAASITERSLDFGIDVAQALHDRLAWDREPTLEELDQMAEDRPLETLWNAALSREKEVKKAFPRLSAAAVAAWRRSPECSPPSWDFVEAILDEQARTTDELEDWADDAEDYKKHLESERDRLLELRDELKKLRRENHELRSERARAEKRGLRHVPVSSADPASELDAADRLAELERRSRKLSRENEHLHRQLERLRAGEAEEPRTAHAEDAEDATHDESDLDEAQRPDHPAAIAADPNARRRVIRQMLRKLVTKGKIGASHTHEDNVFRGVADHEKGIAKEAIELLYREGVLMPKPTTTDPHVSISPERMPEVEAIISGEVENERLRRFVEA